MAKLDPQSVERMPESVDFFNVKPSLVGIEHGSFAEYPAVHPISNGNIQFRVNSGQCFIDFSKTYMVTKFALLKKEGNTFVPVTKDDPVSFIQGFGATFIKNLKVLFNKQHVFNGNDLYAYNAYMKRCLGIDKKHNMQDLQAIGYFEDGLSQTSGPGFDARRALCAEGKKFETACSLDVDIFQQKKLFLDNMIIDIEIIPNNAVFTLLATDKQEYKYEILDCKLFVKTYSLNPELNHPLQEGLNKGAIAKYNYTRNIIKTEFISPGRLEYDSVLITNRLPKRVFVGLIDAQAYHGKIGMSPFEFKPHGLLSVKLSANGVTVPNSPYKLDWKDNSYIRAYKDLSDATKHGISLEKYEAHSTFYAFDLQLEHDSDIVALQKTGSTAISLNFSVPVPQNGLQLIYYGEFDSILALDCARSPKSDVSV